MKLKVRLPLITSIAALISIIIITVISLLNFKETSLKTIAEYEKQETIKVQNMLRDMVNMSYQMLLMSYESGINQQIEKTQTDDFQLNFKKLNQTEADRNLLATLNNLRSLRYGSDGYIWVNELKPPFKVVMHAVRPDLEGSGHVFIIKETNQNVYEAFAEICNKYGEGYLQYDFYPPGGNERIPKLSFLKLFPQKNWVIGTGVYIDDIEKNASRRKDELNKEINRLILIIILVTIVIIAISSAFLFYTGTRITNAIDKVRLHLNQMAQGQAVGKLILNRKDEIGDMIGSLDALIMGISSYTGFAREIGRGNLEANFAALSPEDELGNALLAMRQSLSDARNEEALRKVESERRNWSNEGIARFNDVLRQNQDNLETLAFKLIQNYVGYLNANQGGLFIAKHDETGETILDLVAAYALNRKKHLQRKVKLKEGLVGSCAKEQNVLYITRIPEDYINITSGLGHTKPKCILLVPFKLDKTIYGVAEIASLNYFEPHEIEFAEKVAENISSVLANIISKQNIDLISDVESESLYLPEKDENIFDL